VALVWTLLAPASQAAASLPWTPSPLARHHLALLVDDAGLELPLSQWPLPSAAVAEALDRLPPTLSSALDAARAQIAAELRAHSGSSSQLTLRNSAESLVGFGDDAAPSSSFVLASSRFGNEHAAAQLGVRLNRNEASDAAPAGVRFEGSAVATEALGVQWQAWVRRSWWSPGWQSSLVLGNNAPAFAGLSLQRASAVASSSPWLAWLGPWNFELFAARLDGTSVPAHPFLIGNRLTLRPFSGLEIGITRAAQWGGRGRSHSLPSFVNMLFGRQLNADTDTQREVDPANEMGGFDLRLRCPSWLRCASYLQLIGEDQAGSLPSRYLGLYGLEAWSDDGRQRWFAELAETGCRMPILQRSLTPCAYRNYAYPEGYVFDQRWLGAGVGPDSRLLTLGWMNELEGSSLRLHYGRVGSSIGRYSALTADPQSSGRLVGIVARQSLRWGSANLTPELSWLRIRALAGARTELRAGLTLSLSLDDLR
jgi:Capsule assembly protein Wzi